MHHVVLFWFSGEGNSTSTERLTSTSCTGKWRIDKGKFLSEGEFIKTEQIFKIENLETKSKFSRWKRKQIQFLHLLQGFSSDCVHPNEATCRFNTATNKWIPLKGCFQVSISLFGKSDQIQTEKNCRRLKLTHTPASVNNEFCYFPLDLQRFEGKVNKTAKGEYCGAWDDQSEDSGNYCVTDKSYKGSSTVARRGY